MRIVLDAMGSDNYPEPEIEGAALAAREFGIEVILCGDEAKLKPLVPKYIAADKLRIEHAPDVVAMDEKPAFASRRKADNSMARGLQLVRDGEADAFVTMGNTGAALTNGLFILKRIPGVKRPALTAKFPTAEGQVVVLDIGANADCRPEFLQQFAVMGDVFSKTLMDVQNPRVGILSNGEEAGKGNDLVRESFKLLENTPINFVGNIEPKALFAGAADVVVTDGFSGNIMLKTAEGVARFMSDTLRRGFMGNPATMVAGMLSRSVFADLRTKLDPAEIGAVPLLGLDGLAFVGHGSSNARAVRSALQQSIAAVEADFMAKLRSDVETKLQKPAASAA